MITDISPASEHNCNYLLERIKMRFDGEPKAVQYTIRELAHHSGIDFDEERFLGTKASTVFTFCYQYSLTQDRDSTIVTQDISLSKWWLASISIPTFLVGLGFVLPTTWAKALLLTGTLYLLQLDLANRENLVLEETQRTNRYRYLMPVTIVVLCFVALIAIATAGTIIGYQMLSRGAGVALMWLGVVVGFRYNYVVDLSSRIGSRLFVGSPPIRYGATTTMLVLPAVSTVIVTHLFPAASPAILLVGGTMSGGVLSALYYITTEREFKQARYSFKQGYTNISNPYSMALALFFSIVPAYVGVSMFVQILGQFGQYLNPPLTQPAITLSVLLLIAPGGLLAGGVIVQLISGVKEMVQLLSRSQRVKEADLGIGDGEVRVVDRDDGFASSFSVGIKHYVFVSKGLYDSLERSELRALIAHEWAHVKHGDAFVSFLAPYIASLLLIGRNVFFSALDFRTREFRADAFAAEETTPDTLKRAIRKTKRIGSASSARSLGPSFTPFVPEKTIPPVWILQYYRLFFGGFALSEAHPDVKERLNAIDALERET